MMLGKMNQYDGLQKIPALPLKILRDIRRNIDLLQARKIMYIVNYLLISFPIIQTRIILVAFSTTSTLAGISISFRLQQTENATPSIRFRQDRDANVTRERDLTISVVRLTAEDQSRFFRPHIYRTMGIDST